MTITMYHRLGGLQKTKLRIVLNNRCLSFTVLKARVSDQAAGWKKGGPGPVSKSPFITVVSGGRIEGFRGVTFMRSLIPLKRAEPFLDPPLSNTSHCGVECST